jgi:hypothetical protein
MTLIRDNKPSGIERECNEKEVIINGSPYRRCTEMYDPEEGDSEEYSHDNGNFFRGRIYG